METAKASILSHINVIDFSRVVAAPFASMILGDLGAKIWKIERPKIGDESRSFYPPMINGQSCYTLSLNRNKKSVAINLANSEGRELARKLSMRADVLIENFKTGYMKKFELDYENLKRINSRLIYCSISGYGPDGPYSEDPGYDVIAAAIGEPCKPGVAVTDLMTGLYAHGAILAALLHRDKKGEGQQIQCNLLSTQLATLINIGSNYINAGIEGKPWGTEHESIVPYQAFRTKDGRYYVVGAGNDQAFIEAFKLTKIFLIRFLKLCTKMEMPELANNPEYATNSDRVKNREKLLKKFKEKFLTKDLEFWKNKLRSKSFPSGPVNTIKEAFEHEQTKHLDLVKIMEHPKYGNVKVVGQFISNRILF
uniref:CoA transferase n=1 Tax=Meloidogyne javanica TaxID=6303 RepID=A0A915LRS3_MELJA